MAPITRISRKCLGRCKLKPSLAFAQSPRGEAARQYRVKLGEKGNGGGVGRESKKEERKKGKGKRKKRKGKERKEKEEKERKEKGEHLQNFPLVFQFTNSVEFQFTNSVDFNLQIEI